MQFTNQEASELSSQYAPEMRDYLFRSLEQAEDRIGLEQFFQMVDTWPRLVVNRTQSWDWTHDPLHLTAITDLFGVWEVRYAW